MWSWRTTATARILFKLRLVFFAIQLVVNVVVNIVNRPETSIGESTRYHLARHLVNVDKLAIDLREIALLALTLIAVPLRKLAEVIEHDIVVFWVQSEGVVRIEEVIAISTLGNFALKNPTPGCKTEINKDALHIPATAVRATVEVHIILHILEAEEEVLDVELLLQVYDKLCIGHIGLHQSVFLHEIFNQVL
jgi:hypothetical protein